jgi:hypothetical protein
METKAFKVIAGLFAASVVLCGAQMATAKTILPVMTTESLSPVSGAALGGDFDGDGRRDEVMVVRDQARDRLDIRVRLNRLDGVQDIKVTSVSAREGYNLRVTGDEAFRRDCGDGAACEADSFRAPHDSVLVSLDAGMDVLVYWNGKTFEQDFVSSDEVLMRRALSALYAFDR